MNINFKLTQFLSFPRLLALPLPHRVPLGGRHGPDLQDRRARGLRAGTLRLPALWRLQAFVELAKDLTGCTQTERRGRPERERGAARRREGPVLNRQLAAAYPQRDTRRQQQQHICR